MEKNPAKRLLLIILTTACTTLMSMTATPKQTQRTATSLSPAFQENQFFHDNQERLSLLLFLLLLLLLLLLLSLR